MVTQQGNHFKNDKGVTLIIVALALVGFLGIAALAVDIGYTRVAWTELQRGADAAALAGARQLGYIYECKNSTPCDPMGYVEQLSYDATSDSPIIVAAATGVAFENRAAGSNIVIDSADVEIGTWDPTRTPRFVATFIRSDAVKVTARRDNTSLSTGPISTFFARILGIDTVIASKVAVAALTAQSTMEEGGLSIPLGISDNNSCNDNIQLHPTKSSCAGWHGFLDAHNANWIAELMERQTFPESERSKNQWQTAPPYVSPEINAYETNPALQPDFNGGDLASNFDSFEKLFNYMKTRDGDGNDDKWTTSVVIYKDDATAPDCTNPNGHIMVVGFATFVISEVVGPSSKTFYGQLQCGFTEPGRGGGGYAGNKGSIPGIVQ